MKVWAVVGLALLGFSLAAAPAESQALEAAGLGAIGTGLGVLGGSVEDALDNLMDRSQILTANLASQGDLLGASIAARLEVLVRNAQIVLREDLGQALNRLEPEVEGILLQLAAIHDSIDSAQRTALDLSDYLALDLENTSVIIRGLEKEEFLVRRVDGYVLNAQQGAYRLNLRGLGIGLGTGRTSSTVRAYVNGRLIPERNLSKVSQNDLAIAVPSVLLSDAFFNDKVARAVLRLEVDVFTKRRILPDSTNSYSLDIPLLLLPRIGATIKPTVVREMTVWDEKTVLSQPIAHTTPHAKTKHPHIYTHVEAVDQNSKIVTVEYDCTGGGCGWCYNPDYKPGTPHPEPMIEYSPSFLIRNEGREVLLTRYCDGGPATLKWTVKYIKKKTVKVEEGLPQLKVGLGKTFEVTLPPGTIDWAFSGRMFSGDKIMAKKGDLGPFLKREGVEAIGDEQRLVVRLVGLR
jgi:hypothetical protein